MNHIEKIREKWNRGELCIGANISMTDATVSEIYGEAGYDFVWLDCEHAAMSVADALNHVRAARGAGAAAFIRVPSNDPVVMKPFLELHPAAVIIPRISSVEDAELAVAGCRYPPRGIRGFGPSRGIRFGETSIAEYIEEIDDQLMVILQIEHIDAVNQIEQILDVPGIDSVTFGPADLSATMGLPGQGGHPDVKAAVRAVIDAVAARGIPAGHSVGFDADELKEWLSMKVSWAMVGGDWPTLSHGARTNAAAVREIAGASRRKG
jgi:2-keto-3-deoxy-L-rhamnonate aldolase RhmA